MKTDKDLSDLLQEWTPKPEPRIDFNRSVWFRIQSVESRKIAWLPLVSWIQRLATPHLAATCLAVALFGGILSGGLQARSSQEERYLLSLTPYAASSLVR